MPIGTVKWFDCKKGFGFILDEQQQDVFVHYSVIEGGGFRRLFDGEKVEFESMNGPKGLSAAWVRKVMGADQLSTELSPFCTVAPDPLIVMSQQDREARLDRE